MFRYCLNEWFYCLDLVFCPTHRYMWSTVFASCVLAREGFCCTNRSARGLSFSLNHSGYQYAQNLYKFRRNMRHSFMPKLEVFKVADGTKTLVISDFVAVENEKAPEDQRNVHGYPLTKGKRRLGHQMTFEAISGFYSPRMQCYCRRMLSLLSYLKTHLYFPRDNVPFSQR